MDVMLENRTTIDLLIKDEIRLENLYECLPLCGISVVSGSALIRRKKRLDRISKRYERRLHSYNKNLLKDKYAVCEETRFIGKPTDCGPLTKLVHIRELNALPDQVICGANQPQPNEGWFYSYPHQGLRVTCEECLQILKIRALE